MKHWHAFLREAVNVTSMEVFKARLHGALGDLIELKVSQLITGSLD